MPRTLRKSREGVAFVLTGSGGGAKACFEAGVAATLAERGIRPDIVCGI
jgi:predicted acylesterase/phospholipase RssA